MLKKFLLAVLAIPVSAALACLILGAYMIPALLVQGWVLTHLWAWFVAPLFGLPALGIAAAIGLNIVTHFLTSTRNGREIEKKLKGLQSFNHYLTHAFVLPLLLLGVGYLVKGWL